MHRRLLLPVRALAVAGLLAASLAGCASSGPAAPQWQANPSFDGEGHEPQISPIVPGPPQQSGGSTPSSPGRSGPSPNTSTSPGGTGKGDPDVVAKYLTAPVGLALLPDGTALVGERTTGRIVRVHPESNRPVTTVRTLSGLSTMGGGGLLDLAVSPYYQQDNLIYAYITTATDNRVVAFTLHGPVTPVLTGIPRGRSDNAGRIMFDPQGNLYVATGDAGRSRLALRRNSLAGKVLRVTDVGDVAPGNPTRSSPVYTLGHRDPSGLCLDQQDSLIFETEARPGSADVVNRLQPGASYGWPSQGADPGPAPQDLPAADRDPGGCAVLDGVIYVTSLDGHALLSSRLRVSGSSVEFAAWHPLLVNKYGRLRTVVAAPDGALWLTTSNRDGHGHPIRTDERVLRIVPPNGGAGGSVT